MNKAIVLVDVQNDFIDGALRNEKAIDTVPKIIDFVKNSLADDMHNVKLYATIDTHEQNYKYTLEGQKLPVEHCIEGTKGWEINDDLWNVINGKCTVVNKPTFGSFDLAEIIAEDFENTALDEIILIGFCTDICVVSNALILRAKFPNKNITVMQNLCAGTTDKNHDAALDVMRSCQIDVV